MKKLLLLCAALCLFASSAHAVGCDLTVIACPGGAGASNDAGTLDCAGGAGIILLGTFQPNEAITDLVAADAILDFNVTGGVAASNFWDLEVANNAALGITRARPAICSPTYANSWSPAGSGEGAAAAVQSATRCRVATTCYRPTNLNAALNAKLFGFQLSIDGSTAFEAGGTATGCLTPVGVSLQQLTPQAASGAPTTILTTGSQMLNTVIINGAGLPTPTTHRSWGALKSLYR